MGNQKCVNGRSRMYEWQMKGCLVNEVSGK